MLNVQHKIHYLIFFISSLCILHQLSAMTDSQTYTQKKSSKLSDIQLQRIAQMLLNDLQMKSNQTQVSPEFQNKHLTRANTSEQNASENYEKEMSRKMSHLITEISKTIVDSHGGDISKVLLQRLIMIGLLLVGLPSEFQCMVELLVKELLYCYFDEQGHIIVSGPEFEKRNEAAALAFIQFIQNAFGSESTAILEAIATPVIKDVFSHMQNSSWVKERNVFMRPTPQEACHDSIAHDFYSRIGKIRKLSHENQRLTNEFIHSIQE